jgi:hypothetical protein
MKTLLSKKEFDKMRNLIQFDDKGEFIYAVAILKWNK